MAPMNCGLYVGGETLSLLALQPNKKGWMVQGGTSEFHTLGENDDLSPAIKALCKHIKVSKADVSAILPKQQAILRNVLLPSVDRDELTQMVRFEAERHIPFHAERHSTGFHVMRSMGVEGSEVLMSAVDSPIVQRLLDGAAAAGLTLKGGALSSVCLMNTLLYHRRDWIKGKTVAILSMGLDALDLVLVSDGRVIFARSVSMDLRSVLETWIGHTAAEPPRPDMQRLAVGARMIDCTNLEGNYSTSGGAPNKEVADIVRTWIDRLIQEMRRTYDFARREMKCPPVEAVALTGEGALLRNLAQYLYVNLNVEVQTLNPLEGLERPAGVKFPFDGFEFAIPFGGAISGQLDGAYRIDLTPTEHYRKLDRKRMAKHLIVTGVLAAVTLGLGVGEYLHHESVNQMYYTAYDQINKSMDAKVAQISEREKKLGIIKEFTDDPNSALKVLGTITDVDLIPNKVTITMLNYTKGNHKDKEGLVSIEGDAKTLLDVNELEQRLKVSNCFDAIDRPQSAPDPGMVNNQGMYMFKFDCALAGGKKNAETRGKSGQ